MHKVFIYCKQLQCNDTYQNLYTDSELIKLVFIQNNVQMHFKLYTTQILYSANVSVKAFEMSFSTVQIRSVHAPLQSGHIHETTYTYYMLISLRTQQKCIQQMYKHTQSVMLWSTEQRETS